VKSASFAKDIAQVDLQFLKGRDALFERRIVGHRKTGDGPIGAAIEWPGDQGMCSGSPQARRVRFYRKKSPAGAGL
jgi:hypothetical protein